ncbi:MAG: glycosyltransferase [Candidatus Micrarchaeota archaeon]|nr:glycosyltransferase [Candidatus Micrarchaeota archaeon]
MIEASIIIPALNEEKYIVKTLESARRQKASFDYEIIVADNNSQDRTVELSEKYADRVVTVKRRGTGIGRNTGARKSRGRMLVFVDADTLIPHNYLEVARAVLEDEGISGLSCSFTFDQHSRLIDAIGELSDSYLTFRGMLGKGEILGFNNAVRRETFFGAGGFPDKPMEDGAFARKLWKKGRVIYLPEPKVITSARRISRNGPLTTAIYYANLALITDLPRLPLKKLSVFKGYVPVR